MVDAEEDAALERVAEVNAAWQRAATVYNEEWPSISQLLHTVPTGEDKESASVVVEVLDELIGAFSAVVVACRAHIPFLTGETRSTVRLRLEQSLARVVEFKSLKHALSEGLVPVAEEEAAVTPLRSPEGPAPGSLESNGGAEESAMEADTSGAASGTDAWGRVSGASQLPAPVAGLDALNSLQAALRRQQLPEQHDPITMEGAAASEESASGLSSEQLPDGGSVIAAPRAAGAQSAGPTYPAARAPINSTQTDYSAHSSELEHTPANGDAPWHEAAPRSVSASGLPGIIAPQLSAWQGKGGVGGGDQHRELALRKLSAGASGNPTATPTTTTTTAWRRGGVSQASEEGEGMNCHADAGGSDSAGEWDGDDPDGTSTGVHHQAASRQPILSATPDASAGKEGHGWADRDGSTVSSPGNQSSALSHHESDFDVSHLEDFLLQLHSGQSGSDSGQHAAALRTGDSGGAGGNRLSVNDDRAAGASARRGGSSSTAASATSSDDGRSTGKDPTNQLTPGSGPGEGGGRGEAAAKDARLMARTVAELLDTERAYITHLYRLVNLYVLPLRGQDSGGPTGTQKKKGDAVASSAGTASHISSSGDGAVVYDITPISGAKRASGRVAATPASAPSAAAAAPAKGGKGAQAGPSDAEQKLTATGLPALSILVPPPGLGVVPPRPSIAHDLLGVGSLLSTSEHERVFNSVEELLPLHVMLLSQLQAVATSAGVPAATPPPASTASAGFFRGLGGGSQQQQQQRQAAASASRSASPLPGAPAAASSQKSPSAPLLTPAGSGAVAQQVGRVFTDFSPFFKMYSRFCAGHGPGDEELRALLDARPALSAFLSAVQADPSSEGQDVFSLLVMPVQRVPRYVLLLRELLKHAPQQDAPGGQQLSNAVERVMAAAATLDAAVAASQNRVSVMAIQRRLRPPPEPSLVAPGREFILAGVLGKVCRPFRVKHYLFFLFNDLLVYGTPATGGLLGVVSAAVGGGTQSVPPALASSAGGSGAASEPYQSADGSGAGGGTSGPGGASSSSSSGAVIRLHQIIRLVGVQDISPVDLAGAGAVSSSHAAALKHAFKVLGQPKSFLMVARDAAEKARWTSAVQKCIAELNKKRASFGQGSLLPSHAAPLLAGLAADHDVEPAAAAGSALPGTGEQTGGGGGALEKKVPERGTPPIAGAASRPTSASAASKQGASSLQPREREGTLPPAPAPALLRQQPASPSAPQQQRSPLQASPAAAAAAAMAPPAAPRQVSRACGACGAPFSMLRRHHPCCVCGTDMCSNCCQSVAWERAEEVRRAVAQQQPELAAEGGPSSASNNNSAEDWDAIFAASTTQAAASDAVAGGKAGVRASRAGIASLGSTMTLPSASSLATATPAARASGLSRGGSGGPIPRPPLGQHRHSAEGFGSKRKQDDDKAGGAAATEAASRTPAGSLTARTVSRSLSGFSDDAASCEGDEWGGQGTAGDAEEEAEDVFSLRDSDDPGWEAIFGVGPGAAGAAPAATSASSAGRAHDAAQATHAGAPRRHSAASLQAAPPLPGSGGREKRRVCNACLATADASEAAPLDAASSQQQLTGSVAAKQGGLFSVFSQAAGGARPTVRSAETSARAKRAAAAAPAEPASGGGSGEQARRIAAVASMPRSAEPSRTLGAVPAVSVGGKRDAELLAALEKRRQQEGAQARVQLPLQALATAATASPSPSETGVVRGRGTALPPAPLTPRSTAPAAGALTPRSAAAAAQQAFNSIGSLAASVLHGLTPRSAARRNSTGPGGGASSSGWGTASAGAGATAASGSESPLGHPPRQPEQQGQHPSQWSASAGGNRPALGMYAQQSSAPGGMMPRPIAALGGESTAPPAGRPSQWWQPTEPGSGSVGGAGSSRAAADARVTLSEIDAAAAELLAAMEPSSGAAASDASAVSASAAVAAAPPLSAGVTWGLDAFGNAAYSGAARDRRPQGGSPFARHAPAAAIAYTPPPTLLPVLPSPSASKPPSHVASKHSRAESGLLSLPSDSTASSHPSRSSSRGAGGLSSALGGAVATQGGNTGHGSRLGGGGGPASSGRVSVTSRCSPLDFEQHFSAISSHDSEVGGGVAAGEGQGGAGPPGPSRLPSNTLPVPRDRGAVSSPNATPTSYAVPARSGVASMPMLRGSAATRGQASTALGPRSASSFSQQQHRDGQQQILFPQMQGGAVSAPQRDAAPQLAWNIPGQTVGTRPSSGPSAPFFYPGDARGGAGVPESGQQSAVGGGCEDSDASLVSLLEAATASTLSQAPAVRGSAPHSESGIIGEAGEGRYSGVLSSGPGAGWGTTTGRVGPDAAAYGRGAPGEDVRRSGVTVAAVGAQATGQPDGVSSEATKAADPFAHLVFF